MTLFSTEKVILRHNRFGPGRAQDDLVTLWVPAERTPAKQKRMGTKQGALHQTVGVVAESRGLGPAERWVGQHAHYQEVRSMAARDWAWRQMSRS